MNFESNILNEISTKLKESISSIIFDGELHRFGKKLHAWYVAKKWKFNDRDYQEITFGSWKYAVKQEMCSWEDGSNNDDEEFLERRRIYNEEQQRRLKAKTLEKQKRCIEKWQPIWDKAKQNTVHDYLKHKKVFNDYGTRITEDNILLIPVYNINGFVGVQQILHDADEDNGFKKKFSYGIAKRGSIYPLKRFSLCDKCYVGEGFVTCATVQNCFLDTPVVCAFDSGNIIPAIKTIRSLNPDIKIMIASDYDLESKTGQTYANKAVKQFSQVSYRFPVFNSGYGEGKTDFNDLYCLEGRERVIELLKF